MSTLVVKYYFWVYLWRCVQKILTFKSVDWEKKFPHQYRWASFTLSGAPTEQKRKRIGRVALLELGHPPCVFSLTRWPSSSLQTQVLAPLLFHFPHPQVLCVRLSFVSWAVLAQKPSDLDWTTALAFPALHFADGSHGTCSPPRSGTLALAILTGLISLENSGLAGFMSYDEHVCVIFPMRFSFLAQPQPIAISCICGCGRGHYPPLCPRMI